MANIQTRLTLLARKRRGIARVATILMGFYGIDIPAAVEIGRNFKLVHRGIGTVLHPATSIKDNVTIYHGVTVGRVDSWVPLDGRAFPGVSINDWSVLCPGAVVLSGDTQLTIGTGTVIAANAVLTRSTGDWEIWAGSPARRISRRLDRPDL